MQLASFGSKVIERRAAFVRQLNDIIGAIHYRLSGGKEEIRVVYEPDVTEENFEEQLKRNQERDIRMKMTGTGPHRDDFFVSHRRGGHPEVRLSGAAADGRAFPETFGNRAGEKDDEGYADPAVGRCIVRAGQQSSELSAQQHWRYSGRLSPVRDWMISFATGLKSIGYFG